MSEGVNEISDRFEDNEPDAVKNTDIDDQNYSNVRAFKSSPRDGVVVSGKIAQTHTHIHTHTYTYTHTHTQTNNTHNTLQVR